MHAFQTISTADEKQQVKKTCQKRKKTTKYCSNLCWYSINCVSLYSSITNDTPKKIYFKSYCHHSGFIYAQIYLIQEMIIVLVSQL